MIPPLRTLPYTKSCSATPLILFFKIVPELAAPKSGLGVKADIAQDVTREVAMYPTIKEPNFVAAIEAPTAPSLPSIAEPTAAAISRLLYAGLTHASCIYSNGRCSRPSLDKKTALVPVQIPIATPMTHLRASLVVTNAPRGGT